MNTNMESSPDSSSLSPIELQALMAEKSAAEQAVSQKEQELLFAKQKLDSINTRIIQSIQVTPFEAKPTDEGLITPIATVSEEPNIESIPTPVDTVEVPVAPQENKTENIFSKGEERYAMIAEKISVVKESAKARISKVGTKLSNFFGKVKDFGLEVPKSIAVGVLSLDTMANKAGEKIASTVGAGLTSGSNALDKGLGFIDDNVNAGFEGMEKGIVTVATFVAEKAAAMKKYGEEKAILGATILAYKAQRTKEGIVRIQESIFTQFRRLNKFMTEAGNFASAEAKKIKMKFKNEILAYKMKQLENMNKQDELVIGNVDAIKQQRTEEMEARKAKILELTSLRENLGKVLPSSETTNLQAA